MTDQTILPSPSSDAHPVLPPARNWIKILQAYKDPDLPRSLFELAVTVLPFLAFWAAALWATTVSYWLVPLVCIPGGFFLVRLFLIQHDCAHGAFFASRQANLWVGRVLGIFTLTPFDLWQKTHLIHHASHGNLEKRGVGDIITLTVEEYNAKSLWGRIQYKLYRHPVVLFGLGPAFIFMLHHRLPVGFMKEGPRYWVSTMATNVALAALLIGGILVFGIVPFLVTWAMITVTAATIGVWLFYVQHQFEDTVWEEADDWQLHDAALYGSSHYALPAPLQWLTANIGIHHVHHLYSKVPFYKLHKVIKDHPVLAETRKLTLWQSFKSIHLKLWDAENRRLVPFRVARARRRAAA